MKAKYIKEDQFITPCDLKVNEIYTISFKNNPKEETIWICITNNNLMYQCEYSDLYIFLKHWRPQCMTMAYEE